MKKNLLLIAFAICFLGAAIAQAHPGHGMKPHCDPWIAPNPNPTPPPSPGPGDFTAEDWPPVTPPPEPIQPGGEVSFAYGDCDEIPPPTPTPTPPPVDTPPPEPSDAPDPGITIDPGTPYLEGSGKFGCSMTAVAGSSTLSYLLLGLGLTAPLLSRRAKRK